jgi:hypothetical protein
MKRSLIATGVLMVIGLLLVVTLRATAAPDPVRVVQAQIVEQMFDEAGQEVVAQSGKQFVMVELSTRVRPGQVSLNGTAPVATMGNKFVFEIESAAIDDMTFVYRPDIGGSAW